jgi:2,3-dihydroxybiphenyl 1,2-dioxygenase
MITQLGYVGIGVKDANEWEEFATTILGLDVVERLADGTLYLRMDEYHHRFMLHPNGNDDIVYAGWMVPTQRALEEFKANLTSHGVTVEAGTKEEIEQRRVVNLIKFQDPNGVRLEAFYGLQVRSEEPFQPSRPITGFKAGELGLGHIVLIARDIEETTRFYRDILGLRLSDFIDYSFGPHTLRLVFLHANPRHHSVAFGQIPSQRKLVHFMLELQSIDDVGATYYLCQEKGIRISSTLGRHSNDKMVSFYMVSPSGFEVEYGFGGRLVDDTTWVIQLHKTASIWGHQRSYLTQ